MIPTWGRLPQSIPVPEYCCLASRELDIRRGPGPAPKITDRLVRWSAEAEVWLVDDETLVTIGKPEDCCGEGCPRCHDCDSMGCGSFSHVVSREPAIVRVRGVY